MFKKKCLFGGGLCLGSSIAIFASISSDVIAQEFTAEARNTLTQIYWRTHAHNIIEETKWKLFKKEIKDKPWFIDKDYDESIKKVIGKAIADCLTNMNEFQDKDKGTEEIITFKNTNPENYDQANWNAVMLYNYVNEATKGEKTTTEERLNVCHDRIQQCYRDVKSKKVVSTKEAIKKARDDIGKYVKALGMEKRLNVLAIRARLYMPSRLNFDVDDDCGIIFYKDGCDHPWIRRSQNLKTLYGLIFDYRENKLGIVAMNESRKFFGPLLQFWSQYTQHYFYGEEEILRELKGIEKAINLADLLDNHMLSIFEPSEDAIEEYKASNTKEEEGYIQANEKSRTEDFNNMTYRYRKGIINTRRRLIGLAADLSEDDDM